MAHIRQSRPEHDGKGQILAHIRQSRPDSGLGFQVKALKTVHVVPTSLGRVRSRGVQRALSATHVTEKLKNVYRNPTAST